MGKVNVLRYCVVVVIASFLLLLFSLVHSQSVNFTWTDVKVYGQRDFLNVNVSFLSLPEDLIITTNDTLLCSTHLVSNLSFYNSEEFNKNSSLPLPVAAHNTNQTQIWSLMEVNSSFYYTKYSGLLYDPVTKFVYASDLFASSVTLFLDYFSNPSENVTYSVSPTNLNYPRKLALDCEGRLYVADEFNYRILRFPVDSTTPDLVLGQANFADKTSRNGSNGFYNPAALAFNKDCSVLFVGDLGRILRFRAPFYTNMSAEAVLGCPDFTNCHNTTTPSSSTFSQPIALHYEDMGMNQGRLYILDHEWNRILAGTTTSGASSTILNCLDGNNSSACVITGNVNVVEQQSLLFNATELQVQGDIVFSNSSNVAISSSQTISSLGTVYFAGSLKIVVCNDSFINTTVTTFQYNASSGQFANVEVKAQNQGSGCTTDGVAAYGPHSLSVLITQFCPIQADSQGSNGAANRNIIIGVIVGMAAFLILILIFITVLGILIYFIKRNKWSHRRVAAKV